MRLFGVFRMKSEQGQSLVEFAIVLPLLLLLLLGIVDFGRAFHAYLTVDHAGREAARAASIGRTDVEEVAVKRGSSINLKDTNVTYTTSEEDSVKIATIEINYSINFVTPGLGALFNPFPINNSTVMRIE